MSGTKYFVANAPSATANSPTISYVQAQNLAALPTTTVGSYTMTSLFATSATITTLATSQLNMAGDIAISVTGFVFTAVHDSTSAVASATKTGAANTISGFLKINMITTTGGAGLARYIYTYAVSPTQ